MKFPAKIMIWGMMWFQAFSELHVVPQKMTVNGVYYRDYILSSTCLNAIKRPAQTGRVTERSLLKNIYNFLFMQDGASTHTAKATQKWLTENFPKFWKKGEWPGNSPDLNPIENLWAILSSRIAEKDQPYTIDALNSNLKFAWGEHRPIDFPKLS